MPDFQFPLQTALDLRCREEERAQQRLAQGRRALQAARDDVRRVERRRDEIVEALRGERLSLCEVEHAHRFLSDLRGRLALLRERLEKAQRLCDRRLEELIAASRGRRTLERLSERQEAQHRRREARREQHELNEAAIARHRVTGVAAGLSRADR